MEALSTATFHLTSQAGLAEFEASPFYSSEEEQRPLQSWLEAAGSVGSWSALYAALTTGAALPRGLPSRLAQLAAEAAAELATRGGSEAAGAAAGGGSRGCGADRCRRALQNTFNLSLFFLHHIAKGAAPSDSSTQATAAQAKQSKGDGRGAAPAAQAALLHEAVRGLAALEPLVWEGAAITAPSQVRVAHHLIQSAAMLGLARPLAASAATAKATVDAHRSCCMALLAKPFLLADERRAHGAAAAAVADLWAVLLDCKQRPVVLQGVVELVEGVLSESSRAGMSLLLQLLERARELGSAPSAPAVQGQQEAVASLMAALASRVAAQPALLLNLQEVLSMLCSSHTPARRGWLEASQQLLGCSLSSLRRWAPHAQALLAAVTQATWDRDANLRAKAVGCLAKHAPQLAPLLAAAPAAGPPLLHAICARLLDRSATVRKRAQQLLQAFLHTEIPAAFRSELASAALPIVGQILAAAPDSPLRVGEGTEDLCQVLLMLSESSSGAALPHLIRLARAVGGDVAGKQVLAALVRALLPGDRPCGTDAACLAAQQRCLAALAPCAGRQLRQLHGLLGNAAAGSRARGQAAAIAQLCFSRMHALLAQLDARQTSQAGAEATLAEVEAHAKGIYVLGALNPAASAEEAGVLVACGLRLLAVSAAGSGPAAATSAQSACCWALRAIADGLQALDSNASGAAGLAPPTLSLVGAALQSGGGRGVRDAAQAVLLSLPDPQAPALQLLSQLYAALTPGAAPQPLTAPPEVCCFEVDEECGMLRPVAAPPAAAAPAAGALAAVEPGQGRAAAVAALAVMGCLARACGGGREAFLARLAAAQTGRARPEGAAAAPPSGRRQGGADAGESFDYMEAENEDSKREAAAQAFVDAMLADGDSPLASFPPLLASLLAQPQQRQQGPARAPACIQVAALRSLGQYLLLSEGCAQYLPAVERCCVGAPGTAPPAEPSVAAAAVGVLAAVVECYPNLHGVRLLHIGVLALGPPPEEPRGGEERAAAVRHAAAAAYARLLLCGRFKLQGALGPAGAALVGPDPKVARAVRHAASQLLRGAPSPADRAQLALGLLHQAPPQHRRALAQVISSVLLAPADLHSEPVVAAVLQTVMAAAGAEGAAACGASTILRAMHPSARTLTTLRAWLEAQGSAGRIDPGLAEDLRAFATSGPATSAAPGTEGDGQPAGKGPKRKRGGAGDAAAETLQRVLGLLRAAEGRPPAGRGQRARAQR